MELDIMIKTFVFFNKCLIYSIIGLPIIISNYFWEDNWLVKVYTKRFDKVLNS